MALSLFISLLAKANVNFYSVKTEISYDGLTPISPCHPAHFVDYDLFLSRINWEQLDGYFLSFIS